MDDIGLSGRLGLDKKIGSLPHDFATFQRCPGKCVHLGYVFGHLWVLIWVAWDTDVRIVRYGLPEHK